MAQTAVSVPENRAVIKIISGIGLIFNSLARIALLPNMKKISIFYKKDHSYAKNLYRSVPVVYSLCHGTKRGLSVI